MKCRLSKGHASKQVALADQVWRAADAFTALCLPFNSAEEHELNKQIFETIYHAALEASSKLAACRTGQHSG